MFSQDIVPPIAQFTEIEIGGSVFVFSRETAEKIVHIALNAWQESCWPVNTLYLAYRNNSQREKRYES